MQRVEQLRVATSALAARWTIRRAQQRLDKINVNGQEVSVGSDYTLKFKDLVIGFTSEFEAVWNDKGSGADQNGAFYRPIPPRGFYPVGHLGVRGYDPPKDAVMLVVKEGDQTGQSPPLAKPDDYELVWNDKGSGANQDGAFWRPKAPGGYVALGLVVTRGHDQKPSRDDIRCVRTDLVAVGLPGPGIWNDKGSGADKDFGSWVVLAPTSAAENEGYVAAGTFFGTDSHKEPGTSPLLNVLRVKLDPPNAPTAWPQLPTLAEVLSGQTVKHSYSYPVPFFAVEDSGLSDAQKLKLSPSYIVQRTDEFVAQQQYLNGSTGAQSFTWQVAEGFSATDIKNFSETTGVETVITAKVKEGALIASTEMSFSLKLSQTFTYGFQRSQTTSTTTTRTFPVTVPPGKLTVLWSVQSSFRVFRGDGTALGAELSGIAPNSVAVAEYAPPVGTHVDLAKFMAKHA